MEALNKFFKSFFWVAIALSAIGLIGVIATGCDWCWPVYLLMNVVLFSITAIIHWWKVALLGKKAIKDTNDKILELERGFRKEQKNYDLLRKKLFESKRKLNNELRRKKALKKEKRRKSDSVAITKLEKEIADCQSELEKFNENVMEAYREGGTITSTGISGAKTVVEIEGFRKLKKEKREAQREYVKKGLFPIMIAGVLVIISALIWFVLRLEKTDWVFGPYTLIFLIFFGTAGFFYLFLSIRLVGNTEKGIKFFMGMPYEEVDRGPHLVPWKLGSLVKLPLAVQYYDMVPENVIIIGDESQSIEVDTSIAYHFDKIWDVVTELGTSYWDIKAKLEETTRISEDGSSKLMLGLIGDKVASFVRAYVASGIGSLEEALTMRDGLSEELNQILKDDLQYLGIKFERVVVRGVKPTEAMVSALDKKAISKVQIDQKAFEAKARIKEAEGEKAAIILKGRGEAEANKAKILAEFEAKSQAMAKITDDDVKKVGPYLKFLVFGDKPLAEMAKALQGTSINLVAVPDIDKILNLLGLGNKA